MSENIYYNPEKFDLTLVVYHDEDGCRGFDIHVAFKHKDGSLYYTHDSGCSCPTPFEDVRFQDLEPINKGNFKEFCDSIMSMDWAMSDRIKFLQKVRAELQ